MTLMPKSCVYRAAMAGHPRRKPTFSRQINCFYDIDEYDLQKNYDLVILDGPHGNGRNLAFLIIKQYIEPGTFIFIDDIVHYDFEEKLKMCYDVDEICSNYVDGIKEFGIFCIKSIK